MSAPAAWRHKALTACHATALAALAGLVIDALAQPDADGGGRVALFRTLAMPFVVAIRLIGDRAPRALVLAGVALLASTGIRVLARGPALPKSVRSGFVPLVRELYCWLHALALMPVLLLLTISEASRVVPVAIFFLYVSHLVASEGLTPLVRASRVLASAGALLLLGYVAAVLWGIAPSLAVLTVAAAMLASADATHPAGGTCGVRAVWAMGALLLACSDQWNFVVAGAFDTWVAWRLGLFRHAVTRTMRAAPLAVLLTGQVLVGRGFALVMGFQPANRWWIERQDGVEVVLPYPGWRDSTLGEHITLVAPACDGNGAIVGSLSTSRWVGGGPDRILPRLRRIDRHGRTVALGGDVIEPGYTSVLDCSGGVLAIGEARAARLSLVDPVTLERTAQAELPCVDAEVTAVTELPSLDLWTVSCGSTVLARRDSLAIAGALPFPAFDTRATATGFVGLDATGAYAAQFSARDEEPTLASVYRIGRWPAPAAVATPWGDASATLSRLVLRDATTHQTVAERGLGAWQRYLAAHPRLPFLVASDYLRGRVYLVHLPDLTVAGEWFVGDRPRRAWLDDAGSAVWVGTAVGVVRIDVQRLTSGPEPLPVRGQRTTGS